MAQAHHENLKQAMDTLRAHKMRSALTMFGVVLGVSVIMLQSAAIFGVLSLDFIVVVSRAASAAVNAVIIVSSIKSICKNINRKQVTNRSRAYTCISARDPAP